MRYSTLAALIAAVFLGFGIALASPDWTTKVGTMLRGTAAAKAPGANGHGGGGHGHGSESGEHGEEGKVKLAPEQIASAGIELLQAGPGVLKRNLQLPGTIVIAPEQMASVVGRVPGLLKDVRKRLGDTVTAGEVVAVIDSRDIAEAAGDYLAALRAEQLARVTYEREDALWKKRVSAEQDALQARGSLEAARIKVDQTRQRLAGFGLGDSEIAALGGRRDALPRLYEVKAPASGRVVDRRAVVGTHVAAETELYQIADLSTVMAEIAAGSSDLAAIREGAPIILTADGKEVEATVVLVAPQLDAETRRARVFARIANPDGAWRPGTFVTALVETGRTNIAVAVPRSAIHSIKGEDFVFVRNGEGFEARNIVLGQGDERIVDVAFGLDAGETIAAKNSFVIKAELGKSEAEHSH